MNPAFLQSLFVVALLTPLVAAFVALVTRRYDWSNTLVQLIFAFSGASGLIAVASFFTLFAQGKLAVAYVVIPGAFGFAAGPVAIFFLMIIFVGTLLTSLYAIGSLPHYRNVYSLPWLNVASALFIFGMQATVFSQFLFEFLLFWEIMSVSAYFLVIADRSEESLQAGWLYFVMTHIGFACLVAGFFLMAHGNVFAVWADVSASVASLSPFAQTIAFMLLLAGFGSKAGLVPLHQWLPYAHPQAPSGSSALLSGVMLKVALFGFIQSAILFPAIPLSWALTVVVVGLVSAIFGALHAVVEGDAKRLLAWSSIENMGLIFSGVGISLVIQAVIDPGIAGALFSGMVFFIVLHTLNHFLFKTGLFMAVGAVATKTHTRDLDKLGGLAQAWPLFSGVFLALSLAAAALPPFGTFFGEWAYFQSLAVSMTSSSAIIATCFALVLSVLALVGGLAIFAYVKMFSAVFLGRARSEHAEHTEPMPVLLLIPSAVCATLSIAIGLVALPLFISSKQVLGATDWIGNMTITPGASVNAWLVVCSTLVIALLLIAFRRLMTSAATPRITDTWDCGTPLTARMQYTATGFSAPIRFFFRSVLLSRKELTTISVSSDNPWIARRTLVWSISSFWEHWLYRPVGLVILRVSHLIRRLQSGVIQIYLALILCALIGALIFAL